MKRAVIGMNHAFTLGHKSPGNMLELPAVEFSQREIINEFFLSEGVI